MLLSYLIFTKPLTEQHGSGLLLIAMGITLKMLPDNKPTTNKKALASSPNGVSAKSAVDEEVGGQPDYVGEHEEKRPLV